jgi:hypothetical protein
MKTQILSLWLVSVAVSAFGQAEVVIINPNFPTTMLIQTNGYGGSGPTTMTANSLYYGLFTAPLGTTTSADFVFSGNYATNLPAFREGRLNGGVATVEGWLPGTERAFLLRGWSSDLGHDWANIADQLNTGMWVASGFYGESQIGHVVGGDPENVVGLPYLFGTADGKIQGFTLFAVPEPSILALFGLGSIVLCWRWRA